MTKAKNPKRVFGIRIHLIDGKTKDYYVKDVKFSVAAKRVLEDIGKDNMHLIERIERIAKNGKGYIQKMNDK